MSFDKRLAQYISQMDENGGDIESTWDPDPDAEAKLRAKRATHESDINLEEEYSEDEVHEDNYDADFCQTMSNQEDYRSRNRIVREEKNGENYPRRKDTKGDKQADHLEDDYDSGEDEDRTGENIVQNFGESSNELSFEPDCTTRNEEMDATVGDEAETGNDETVIEANDEEDGELNHLEDVVEGRKKRLYASLREWTLYVCQDRRRFRNRICDSGKLGEVFIIDQVTRIQQQRLAEIEKHNTEFMTSTKKKLIKAFQRTASRHNKTVGAVTSVPVSMPGSPRYLQKKYEDAIAMANKLGKPDLFLTFTCSSSWFEVKDNLKKGLNWAQNPFLLNEVFNKKKESLLNDVLGQRLHKGSRFRNPGIFGAVRWHVFCIEFQARGPPHMHLIISLVEHIKTVQQVDAICSAELPVVPKDKNDPEYKIKSELRRLVEKHMVHTPCEQDNKAYCRSGISLTCKKCRKNFPKPFSNKTEMGDKDYPALRRPNNGESVKKEANDMVFTATNQHVVAYNPYLLSKYRCHMNIEAISSLKVIKYIFKYLFKGYDRALIECFENVGIEGSSSYGVSGEMTIQGHIMMPKNLKLPEGVIQKRLLDAKDQLRKNGIPLHDEHGERVLVYNECRIIEDMRCMTSCEAAWEIAGYGRSGSSHTVTTSFVHRPNEEPIRMEIGEEEEAFQNIEQEDIKSKLKAYFELCSSIGPDAEEAQKTTFEDLPKKFIYNNDKWRLRKRDYSEFTIGKIKFVKPQYMEQFAIRLLCIHKKGVKSFEDLRTVDGKIYDTFIEAAKALRLMNGEVEWEMCLAEAATLKNPTVLRRLFENFYENRKWSEAKKEAHALFHIKTALQSHGFQLEDFFLPEVNMRNMPDKEYWINDAKGQLFTKNESEEKGELLYERLTKEQKDVVDEIVESVESGSGKPFFIEGQGGCGKTLIYETLFYILKGKGMKAICVAHTGVAAGLLPQGSTVHRAFHIPLQVEEKMHSGIELETPEAQHLKDTTVVLWDEATMSDRRIVSAVDELFAFLHPERDALFGGTTFVFGGDWRQTLPIVEGTKAEGVIEYTLIKSSLWEKIKVLHLTQNLRAKQDPEFAQWIKDIGEGANYIDKDRDDIALPETYLVQNETQLIEEIYGNKRVEDENVTATSSILTVDNVTSLEINERVLKMKIGDTRTMLSRDEFDVDRGFAALPAEYYNNLTPSGLPPHKLNLKIGSVVMLLKNINVYLGICNGLRLRIITIGNDIIHCKPINGAPNTPELILLHRMALYPKKGICRELSFVRWQFPIRLAYSLTINKSQGQTLGQVGICLRTPVFTHGQLYVAVSRVRTGANLLIHNGCSEDKKKTRNVVYEKVLYLTPHYENVDTHDLRVVEENYQLLADVKINSTIKLKLHVLENPIHKENNVQELVAVDANSKQNEFKVVVRLNSTLTVKKDDIIIGLFNVITENSLVVDAPAHQCLLPSDHLHTLLLGLRAVRRLLHREGRRSSGDGYTEIRQLLQVARGTDDDSVADIILQSVDEICKEKQAEQSTADHDDFDLESPRSRALSFSPEPLDHRRSNIDIEHDADYNDELLNDEEAYGGGDWMGNDIGDDDDVILDDDNDVILDDDNDVILDDGGQRDVIDVDGDLSPVRAPISPVRDRVIVSPQLVRPSRILPALPRVLAPLNVPQTHPANTVQVPPRVAKPALYGSIEEFCQEYCEHWDNMSPDVQAEIELSVKLACRGVLRATNRARHALKRKTATLTLLDLSVAVGRTFLPVDEGGRTEAPVARGPVCRCYTRFDEERMARFDHRTPPRFGSRFGKIVHTACNVYLSCYMDYRNKQATRISFEKHELLPSDTTQTAATDFSRYVWGLKHRRAVTE